MFDSESIRNNIIALKINFQFMKRRVNFIYIYVFIYKKFLDAPNTRVPKVSNHCTF